MQDKTKSAGDVVIGGLRCVVCSSLFIPDKDRPVELCRACHLYACLRERYSKDPRRLRLS